LLRAKYKTLNKENITVDIKNKTAINPHYMNKFKTQKKLTLSNKLLTHLIILFIKIQLVLKVPVNSRTTLAAEMHRTLNLTFM